MRDGSGVEHFYVLRGRSYVCAYCGDTADTLDHTIPRSLVREHRIGFLGFDLVKVFSCRECNGLLGDKLFENFHERKAFIAVKLAKRYKKYLRAAAWEDSELAELGPGLKPQITTAMTIGKFAERRIKFARFPVTDGVPDALMWRRTATTLSDAADGPSNTDLSAIFGGR